MFKSLIISRRAFLSTTTTTPLRPSSAKAPTALLLSQTTTKSLSTFTRGTCNTHHKRAFTTTTTLYTQLRTDEFRAGRPSVVGPDVPEPPFPITLEGKVQRGFGRGGKDLGCPTANLPDESITPISSAVKTGVYYGFAQVIPPRDGPTKLRRVETTVLPMVMSLGWNPFYKNERLTAEIHIMHQFTSDFYGYDMKAIVLGYIRPELDYTSREALIEDIDFDKLVAHNCLKRPAYQKYSKDPHFDIQNGHL